MEPSERQKWLVRSVRRWGVGDMRSRYFVVAHALRVAPKLDFDRLNRSFREILAARDVLRCGFRGHGEDVEVTVQPLDRFNVQHLQAANEAQAHAWLDEAINRPLDPQSDPLTGLTMIDCGVSTILLLRFHHTVIDGLSASIFIRDTLLSYVMGAAPQPEQATYADFVRSQAERLRSPEGQDDLDHWCARLADAPPRLKLPYDRPDTGAYTSGFFIGDLVDVATSATLKKIALGWNVSLFALLLSVFNINLWALTGETDAPISIPVANRAPARFRDTLGWFANYVFVSAGIDPDGRLEEICRAHHEALQEALERQDVPCCVVQDTIEASFPGEATSLDQVCFGVTIPSAGDTLGLTNILNQPPGRISAFGEFECEVLAFNKDACARDISFFVQESDAINIVGNFRGDVFERSTATEILRMYVDGLRELASTPEETVRGVANRLRTPLIGTARGSARVPDASPAVSQSPATSHGRN